MTQQFQFQVNTERLKSSRIHFCLPCYGGMLTEQTFMSFIKWGNTARQLGIDWAIETMVNESLISRARNTLVAKVLNNPESTHLMFIDADIGWEPWQVLSMLDRDVDVIGGLYPMKTLPVRWVINGFEGAEEGPEGLQEVSKTGTGFMLIKRHVFEKMNAHPAVKPFNSDIGLPKELDQHMKTYFDTAVRDRRYYSEDWTFCENWRDLGGKVWVDKRVLLRHTGTYVFDIANQDSLYEQFHNQAIANGKALPVPGPTAESAPTAELIAENKPASGTKTASPKTKVTRSKKSSSSSKKDSQ